MRVLMGLPVYTVLNITHGNAISHDLLCRGRSAGGSIKIHKLQCNEIYPETKSFSLYSARSLAEIKDIFPRKDVQLDLTAFELGPSLKPDRLGALSISSRGSSDCC
ncbi:unnamed protein product [Lepidochelys kempii]